MFFLKSNHAAGIEIDTGMVRALELKGPVASPSVSAAGQVEIPAGAVEEGVVLDAEAVGEALSRLWKEAGFSVKSVVLGICNRGVIMRRATFPKAVENKIGQVVKFQAGDFFPIALSDMVLDYSLLGEVEGKNGPELEVLLVAARKDVLEKNLAALAVAGLEPVIVDYSPLALLLLLSEAQCSGTVVLVDIARGLTTLLLAKNGRPRFSRIVPYSLASLQGQTRVFIRDLEEPVKGVAAAADDRNDHDFPLIEWGYSLAGEIISSVNYYMSYKGQRENVDCVLLSGRGALIDDLPGILQSELEVPVEVINTEKGSDFAVCTGLALRGLEGK